VRFAAAISVCAWALLAAEAGCSLPRRKPAAQPVSPLNAPGAPASLAPPEAHAGPVGYADAMLAAKAEALRASCQANLRQIGIALEAYALQNDERHPDSLDELIATGFAAEASLARCPATGEPYGFVRGLRPGVPGDWVVAFDRAGAHRGGRSVLLASRSVKWMDEAAFQAALQATLDGAKARGLDASPVGGRR
jgi:hypothetical protein